MSPTPVDPDALLIEQVRRGDAEAWRQLIDRFEGRLVAYVRRRLGDPSAAEDIVQETFIGFLTSLPNYDASTPLESFLFAIAAHKLTDHLRRQGRRPTLALAGSDDGPDAEPAGRGRMPSSLVRSREQRQFEQRVLSEILRKLIDQWIDAGQFERLKCIELLFVLGWSNKDVAHRLGISEQAVANHKHYVISQIKKEVRRRRLRGIDLASLGLGETS